MSLPQPTAAHAAPGLPRRCAAQLLVLPAAPLVALAAFWPVLSATSAWIDDVDYVHRNPLVCQPSWDAVQTVWREVFAPSSVRGYYHPLAMTSLMLDYALGARLGTAGAFRGTSLLLHALNTLLVAVLLTQLGARPLLALLGAAVFGAHPQAVESVAWISERKNLLAACFALLTLAAYLQYIMSGRAGWYAAALLTYLPALLAKPSAIPLPFWLLLLDAWPLGRQFRPRALLRLLAEKLPFFALAALAAVVTYLSQRQTAYTSLPHDLGIGHTATVVLHNLGFYVVSWLAPLNLAPFYSYPPTLGAATPLVWVGAGLLALLPLLAWLRPTRPVAVGLLFFIVGLAPVLGFVGFTNTIAGDRFTYLPALGLLILCVVGAERLVRTWKLARPTARPTTQPTAQPTDRPAAFSQAALLPARLLLAAGGAALVIAAGVGAHSVLANWRDTPTLWNVALSRAAPADRLLLLTNYADLLEALGRTDESRAALWLALEEPVDASGYYAAAARTTLANQLALAGDIPAALPHYYESLRIRPAQPEALNSLAWWRASAADARLRDGAEAVRLAEQAVALGGAHPAYLDTLAAAYAQAGRYADAVRAARHALELARGRMPGLAAEIGDRLRLYEAGRALPTTKTEATEQR